MRQTVYATVWIAVLIIAALIAPLHSTHAQPARQAPPVTLDIAESYWEPFLPDPQRASNRVDFTIVENLFLGLTDVDPTSHEISPELAVSWTTSDDYLTWTFTLRDDVNWVRYDPTTGTMETMRRVVAADLVYGIKRGCAPNRNEEGENFYYGTLLAEVIAGCDVLNATPEAELTEEFIQGETVKVRALSDTVLEIELQTPAAYFLAMTTLPIMRAVPPEAINDSNWAAPGGMWSNGPYVLAEDEVARRVYVKNPTLPAAVWHGGNIEQVNVQHIEDGGTMFALFRDKQLDQTGVPISDISPVYTPEEIELVIQIPDNAVFYFGFNLGKPPFDNVHVRRAFNAIMDRQAFIGRIIGGRGFPMAHFTLPQLPNAPARDEIGVMFDPTYAQEQLKLAGYPNCEGFPAVDMVSYIGAGNWLEFLAAQAEEYLGCDPALLNTEQVEFSILLDAIRADTPEVERPNLWTLGWGSDYPDAHNWLYDVLYCNNDNPFKRPCSEIDDLLTEAATEHDQDRRAALYREIETGFFGPEGEFPIMPIFQRGTFELFQAWFTGPHASDGGRGSGQHWDAYSIDMEAKLAARGE